jgi:hypothetical protein
MISDLIKIITSDPDRYDSNLWDYRISGNLLELSVNPVYSENPEEYRMAVIRIGQILQAIDHQAHLAGQESQIQSFPNIEESKLVAMVRLHRLYGSLDVKSRSNGLKSDSRIPISTLLKSISSHYGLFFHNHNGSAVQEIHELFESDNQKIVQPGRFYSLCTTMDNPFLWLRVGQWIERVNQLLEENHSVIISAITHKIKREQRVSLNSAFADCPYIQVLVQLKK